MPERKDFSRYLADYERQGLDHIYQKMIAELAAAFGAKDKAATRPMAPYDAILNDASAFAPKLGALLEARKEEKIRVAEDELLSFSSFEREIAAASPQNTFDDCTRLIELPLKNPQKSAEKARRFVEKGGDVFGAFEGRWSGLWYHNVTASSERRNLPGHKSAFDHHWQKTRPLSPTREVLLQPVLLGEIPEALCKDPRRQPGLTGCDSKKPQPAINAVSCKTGLILGAVDYDEEAQAVRRPHVGYFVDARTLLWVALEPGGTPEDPRYSLFLEHIRTSGAYLILGVQLRWSRGEALRLEAFLGGRYHNPIGAVSIG